VRRVLPCLYPILFSRSHTDYVRATVVVTAILMEVVAAMVEEVTLTATQVEVDTLTAVDMAAVEATVVEPVEIACLTLELDFRNRTGVS
jgi:hypothetical protein